MWGVRKAIIHAAHKSLPIGNPHGCSVLKRPKTHDGSKDPLGDGQLPVDNNWIENQIRPIAIGRNNWLFAGSLRGGQRAAAVMSLIQSAKLNGHDPHAYLKDVLTRLPMHMNSRIDELLPHCWTRA